jgi:DNA-binding SARP family transcriptional activator/tetratricopeptide (TPR) repeat protein
MIVGLLGPLQVSLDGQPVELPAGRLRALLVVLALSAGQPVPPERLVSAVWGEEPPADARASVRTNVRRLRRELGAARVATHRDGYLLDVEPDRVDALRFSRLLGMAAETLDPAARRDRLSEALALWRGTPFGGVRSDWLARVVAPSLQERYLTALEQRIDLDLSLDPAGTSSQQLIAQLQELTSRHPLRETLWARLLQILARSGRPAEALQQYEVIRVRLVEELGTDPGPELRRVYAELLAGAGAPEPVANVPRQLPAGVDGFIGREAELKFLDGLLDDRDEPGPRPVAISTITGMAGIGKTALAVHWAHQVADRFPDGQLHVNLRGFDPTGGPMTPAEAIGEFLEALQAPPQQVPASLAAQAGLYRSMVAGKRILVLLDNVRDTDQVGPLLPGGPGCLVIVTSRHQLSKLVAAQGAHPLTLGPLAGVEARQLLASRLSYDRTTAEPEATDRIVAQCAGLPLALALVAARAAAHPGHPLATLADQNSGGDPAADLQRVFSWSYHELGAAAARLFRLAGLHPGPDLGIGVAASLTGTSVAQARGLLSELVRAHLLDEPSPGRYSYHDLLRAYAADLARTHDRDADRQAATHRLLDHYLYTARAAAHLIHLPYHETIIVPAPQPGLVPQQLVGPAEAMNWFTTERPVLLAAVNQAARAGFHRHVCQLAWTLFTFLHRQGHWHERAATQRAALAAAERLEDQAEQARAHRNLAVSQADLGRYDDAYRHLRHALDLAGEAGDKIGLGWTHYCRNLVNSIEGRTADALESAQQALRQFEAAGDRAGQAIALTDVGWYHGRLGDHQRALTLLERALALHQELDNRPYQAHSWSCLAETHYRLGDWVQTTASYHRALDLFRECGDRYAQASTLAHLGAGHHAAGESDAARAAWQAARDLLEGLDESAAEQISSQLCLLDETLPMAPF